MSTATNVGHGLAKGLGIKLQYRQDNPNVDSVTRGESAYSVETAESYVESEPTTWDWIRETTPGGRQILNYLYSLFPFVHWIGRYNAQWLAGDLIAGMFDLFLAMRYAEFCRYYRRGRGRSPKYGICETCRASRRVWIV